MAEKARRNHYLEMRIRAFGQKIKYHRKLAALTQEEVAGRAHLAVPTYQKLEKGEGNPTIDTLEAIANALGCSVADIYSGEPDVAMIRRPIPQDLKVLIENSSGKIPWGALSQMLESFASSPPAIRAAILAVLYNDANIAKDFHSGKAQGSSKAK